MNADLVARLALQGIRIPRVAEAALTAAPGQAEKAKRREELQADARRVEALVARCRHPFPDSQAAFAPDDPSGLS